MASLDRAARAPGSLGVRFLDPHERETAFSYQEIRARALELAGGFVDLGLAPGERVAIVLPTGIGFYDALFGALYARLVPVPLYPPLRLGRLDEYHARTAGMITACGATLVLTDKRIGPLLGRTLARANPERGSVKLDDLPRVPLSSLELEARTRAAGLDDAAIVQFSSGTTVAPKPVKLTHGNILANIRAITARIAEAYPESAELPHRGVSWLPLYHDMGLVGCVMAALEYPGELVLLPPEAFVARPALWLRAISRFRGTISPAPNFAYALCAERVRDEELTDVDLSCWRVALNGAEPVTPSVLERFAERFARFGFQREALTPVYGLAEATLAVTFSDLRRPFRARWFDRNSLTREGLAREVSERAGVHRGGAPGDGDGTSAAGVEAIEIVSVGRPLEGIEVVVAGEDGRPLPEGTLGTVQIRGPSVMHGYSGPVEASCAALAPDGWLDSGDQGFLWKGELYLYGRKKDTIVIRGRNVAPHEVEQALGGVEGVRRGCSAAIGVVGENGEELIVLVERARDAATSRRSDAHLEERIGRAVTARTGLVPAAVVLLAPGTLPRTSSGKIRRSEARRQYLLAELSAPKPVNAFRLGLELVRSRVVRPKAPTPRR